VVVHRRLRRYRRREAGAVRACAWCDRVWLGGWTALEDALVGLGVRELDEAGRVSHAICEDCLEAELAALAARRAA